MEETFCKRYHPITDYIIDELKIECLKDNNFSVKQDAI